MFSLTTLLKEEKGKIDKALEKALCRLPAVVRTVAHYAVMNGGKRLRPLLVVYASRFFGRNDENLYNLAATLEMLHVATLIHDDVLDDAETRRGAASAHEVYGIKPCLLAGDALLAEACHMVVEFGNQSMTSLMAQAIVQTVSGEAQEIAAMGSLERGTAEYEEIIRGKTAWLIRTACEMGALYAGAASDMVHAMGQYGMHLGMAFQMVDDALDFADSAVTGKPTGGDVLEGKATPPVLLYAQSLNESEYANFKEKFRSHGFRSEEAANIAAVIRTRGFDTQTRAMAGEHLQEAARCLELLPQGRERKIFYQVIDYVRDRKA